MQRKKKICNSCSKECFIFAKKQCIDCYRKNNQEKFKIKTKTKIKQVSDHHKKQLELYYELRNKYMIEHPKCEKCGSNEHLTLHHKQGRGKNLLKYFCTLCFTCHEWVHNNPVQAEEQGFLTSRIK